MAAFSMPRIAGALSSFGRVARSVLIVLVLGHPLLDLSGDALGLALHQLVDRLEVGVRGARRQLDRRGLRGLEALRLLLELSQRHGLLDLRQPRGRGERLALALAQRAG